MIFIIGFVLLVIVLFRHFYFTSTLEDSRKNTTNGYTYTDCFGQLRLLRNDRAVKYVKLHGVPTLCFQNGIPVDENSLKEDNARYCGDEYYYLNYDGLERVKVVETGEVFLLARFPWYGDYFATYSENGLIQIVRETESSKKEFENEGGHRINIDEMNVVLRKMFEEGKVVTYLYFDEALSRYRALKRLYDNKYKDKPIIITDENFYSLQPDLNSKYFDEWWRRQKHEWKG